MAGTYGILIALVGIYVAVMFISLRRFSHLDWRFTLLVAAVLGVGSGIFVSPWAFIIFGWPGASLGAVISSALAIKAYHLALVGAIVSAAVAMSVLALALSLLIVLLAKASTSLFRALNDVGSHDSR